MSIESQPVLPVPPVATIVRHELHHMRAHWWWFLLLGILLLVGGTAAIADPFIASRAAVSVLSIIMLIAGVMTLVGAFWTGKWSGFLLSVLVGLLYLAGGFVISERPLFSILMITVFLAVIFMVMGVFRVLVALTHRFPQWGWTLLNGCVTFLIGLVIYRQLPLDAVWVIGLLIGVELIFSGWVWIMLALEIRRIPA